ncbi:hypothetical protein [Streptomyces sp. NPDC046862]|uniref:hypothetical protein n=1 Tax=Streptomyces sp. NPDC046862 TaxID=3154603 RepID=UPI0034557DD5
MLALRLARGAQPAVHLRRLLVTAASAGTGFLLLCALGHALAHPDAAASSVLRLVWCGAPLAATAYFAVTVARTDPGTRPRPGLSAIGLGPARLMAVSALTTALSTALGSLLALVCFLHLRGDLTGARFDGPAPDTLAANHALPLPAALTLLSLLPAIASLATALALRPRAGARDGARRTATARTTDAEHRAGSQGQAQAPQGLEDPQHQDARGGNTGSHALSEAPAPGASGSYAPAPGTASQSDPYRSTAPRPAPGGLPWGIAVLAAGLAMEMYASRSAPAPGAAPGLALPGGSADSPAGVLGGWMLTALGLILTGPGLTHLCGRLLQSARPGALRLLAGRVLQEEARRIGRPLGVVCAAASGAYALATMHSGTRPDIGPLTGLGALLVIGCALLTLATAAVEARNARVETVAALLRLGAPATVLRSAALLRAGTLLAVFGPLTWAVAELAATPLVP